MRSEATAPAANASTVPTLGAPERWLLPAIAIGTTLAPLNSTMIAVALPDIQQALGVSVTATAALVSSLIIAGS